MASPKPLVWNNKMLDTLYKWYPHLGATKVAEMLNINRQQVRNKINKLNQGERPLTLLPKVERLCFTCRKAYQVNRRYGLQCRQCYLTKRLDTRKEQTIEQALKARIQHLKRRSRSEFNLTYRYLQELWDKQDGKCFYSKIDMLPIKEYGRGSAARNPFAPSIDKIDPEKGYTVGNVVWCAFVCNAGKSLMSVEEYVKVCGAVADNQNLLSL